MPAPKRFATLNFDLTRSILDAARPRRTNAIVRNWRFIRDTGDADAFTGECADCGFATGADATDDYRSFRDTRLQSFVADEFAHLCRRKRRAFLGSCESEASARRPRNGVATLVGEDSLGVVKSRLYEKDRGADILADAAGKGSRLKTRINGASSLANNTFFSHNSIDVILLKNDTRDP